MVNVPRSLTPARPQMTQRRRITPNATPFCLPTAPDPRSFAVLDSLSEKSFILFTSPPPLFPAVLARHRGPKRTPRKHDTATGKKVKCVRACVREGASKQLATRHSLRRARISFFTHYSPWRAARHLGPLDATSQRPSSCFAEGPLWPRRGAPFSLYYFHY